MRAIICTPDHLRTAITTHCRFTELRALRARTPASSAPRAWQSSQRGRVVETCVRCADWHHTLVTLYSLLVGPGWAATSILFRLRRVPALHGQHAVIMEAHCFCLQEFGQQVSSYSAGLIRRKLPQTHVQRRARPRAKMIDHVRLTSSKQSTQNCNVDVTIHDAPRQMHVFHPALTTKQSSKARTCVP